MPGECAEAVEDALRAAGAAAAPHEAVAEEDWSERWREGLEAIEISPRLLVRPPFVAREPRPGQTAVVIEPGQAFGTGGHESTRLALALLDEVIAERAELDRMLDVGTGSGVLAIAGVRLGVGHAVGFDLDPLAAEAARENARANGASERTRVFTGGIEAIAAPPFPLVVANLLRREVLPILPEIGARVEPGGDAVFAGLLASDRSAFEEALGASGLAIRTERVLEDASGEGWLGLVARRLRT